VRKSERGTVELLLKRSSAVSKLIVNCRYNQEQMTQYPPYKKFLEAVRTLEARGVDEDNLNDLLHAMGDIVCEAVYPSR
jgi:hypothetical protein